MLPFTKDVDDEMINGKAKIQCSPLRIFVFLCFAALAVAIAFGAWNIAYSFTNKDPSQFPNLLSEKCFATFFMIFGYLWEVPEKYITDAEKKAEVYKLFENFSYQRKMRSDLYFIDPFTFLTVILITASAMEFYNFCCFKFLNKTYFGVCFSFCYDIFYFTFLMIFAVEAYNFFAIADHKEFLGECLKKVGKH